MIIFELFDNSPLFVPCDDKYLSKVDSLKSTTIIFDLEDSIKDDKKQNALESLLRFLDTYKGSKKIWVRINNDRMDIEISELKDKNIVGFMLPKTESYEMIDNIVTLSEASKIWVLIETPMGIANLPSIASHPALSAIMFGGEDYANFFSDDSYDAVTQFAKNMIVLYGRAFNLPVFDTISWNYRDLKLFKEEVLSSKRFGFYGKVAIHPDQVDVIEEVFEERIEDQIEIIEKFDQNPSGILIYKGKIYERPHIEKMKSIVKKHFRNKSE